MHFVDLIELQYGMPLRFMLVKNGNFKSIKP